MSKDYLLVFILLSWYHEKVSVPLASAKSRRAPPFGALRRRRRQAPVAGRLSSSSANARLRDASTRAQPPLRDCDQRLATRRLRCTILQSGSCLRQVTTLLILSPRRRTCTSTSTVYVYTKASHVPDQLHQAVVHTYDYMAT